jgi:hypothetical protein
MLTYADVSESDNQSPNPQNLDGKGLAKPVAFPHSPFCPGRGVLDAWQSCRRGRFPMALPKETMRFLKDPKSITQISKKKPEEFEAHSLMFNH